MENMPFMPNMNVNLVSNCTIIVNNNFSIRPKIKYTFQYWYNNINRNDVFLTNIMLKY